MVSPGDRGAEQEWDRAFLGCWEDGALLQPRFGISGPLVDAAGEDLAWKAAAWVTKWPWDPSSDHLSWCTCWV